MVNTVGFVPTMKKSVKDVALIKVTPHGANVNSTHAFQSMALSIVDSVQIFHATSKSDILIQTTLKAKEML